MTPEQWQQVERVLDHVLEHDPDEWPALLEEACAGDEQLRRTVSTLLRRYTRAGKDLEAPTRHVVDLLDPRFEESVRRNEGQCIGPYRLVRRIQRGGMGTVYLAERADGQYEQKVALKLLRWGSGARPNEVRRFRAERQILANLQHPNIARLLDGGVTEEGQHYLVMEYVEGQPIDQYCDERRLPVAERLELFLTVCKAVEQAHRQLIVHRDLKPSNILVTSEGTVKLLDFGIAKILDEKEASLVTLPVTRTGMRLMTPEYAAPEQVAGEQITTATDIYQLGVVLYELLVGRRPFEFTHHRSAEIERVILEEAPERPSAAVIRQSVQEDDAHPPEQVSRARSTELDSLRSKLRGDLDTIVLKALRKEPKRRYASAGALMEDIERYLRGLPVKAQKATLGYRMKKFVRRHRWGVGTVLAFLVLLLAYAATITLQAHRIAEQRDRAQTEAQKAKQVSAFLVDLFRASDPLTKGHGKDLTVEDVLDRGGRRVTEGLNDQPVVQADLMTVIGRVYTSLGLYPKAAPLLRSALMTRKHLLGASHPDVADTERALAYMLFRQGRFEAADSLYRHALAILRQSYDADDPRLAPYVNGRALVLDERGQFAEAEQRYRRAISLARKRDTSSVAAYLHNLAISLQNQGRFDQAIDIHRRALAAYRRAYGDAHPAVANAVSRMAFTYHQAGKLAVAESLYSEALAAQRDLLPEVHPHLASTLIRMGWVLVERGRPDEAESLVVEGRTILEKYLPEGHWQIIAARGVLGVCAAAQGRFAEAEVPLRKSYRLFRDKFGLTDWRTRSSLQALVQLYTGWNRQKLAAAYRDTLAQAARDLD